MRQKDLEKQLLEAIGKKSINVQLREHMRLAEEHLIAAVKLFSLKTPPDRSAAYFSKLTRNQESVTTLMREELVRAIKEGKKK